MDKRSIKTNKLINISQETSFYESKNSMFKEFKKKFEDLKNVFFFFLALNSKESLTIDALFMYFKENVSYFYIF